MAKGRIGIWIHWVIWSALVLLHLVGFISMTSDVVPLQLVKGSSARVTLFRVFPARLQLALKFERSVGNLRPELGRWVTNGPTDRLHFYDPGAPVKLLVTGDGAEAVFTALPPDTMVSLYDTWPVHRKFIPFSEGDSQNDVQWPPANELRPMVPFGFSSFQVTVLNVGEQISGENVSLVIDAPISPKQVASRSYLWLAWLMLVWPLNLALILFYGVFLSKKTWDINKLILIFGFENVRKWARRILL